MRKRLLIEAVVVVVQTAIMIGLTATIGLSGSDRETQAESAEAARTVLVDPESGNRRDSERKRRAGGTESPRCPEPRLPALPRVSALSGRA